MAEPTIPIDTSVRDARGGDNLKAIIPTMVHVECPLRAAQDVPHLFPHISQADQVSDPGAYWWRGTPRREWFVVNVTNVLRTRPKGELSFMEPWVIGAPARLHGEFIGPLAAPAQHLAVCASTGPAEECGCRTAEHATDVRANNSEANTVNAQVIRAIQAAQVALAANHNCLATDLPDLTREEARGWTTDHRQEIDGLEQALRLLGVTDTGPECNRCSTPPSGACS